MKIIYLAEFLTITSRLFENKIVFTERTIYWETLRYAADIAPGGRNAYAKMVPQNPPRWQKLNPSDLRETSDR